MAFPLIHFVRAARDTLLRGADGRAWRDVGWLAALAAACTTAATVAYRWQQS